MSQSIADLIARGYRARAEKDPVESRAAFIEAVRQSATAADRPSLAEALSGLAQAERDLDNLPAAGHHYENAVVLYRQLGLEERLAYALRHQADVLRESDRGDEAEPLFREAAQIYRRLGESAVLDLANTLRGLALLHEAAGRIDLSNSLWKEARELYAKRNVEVAVAECSQRLSE